VTRARIPNWAETPQEVQSYIDDAHAACVDIPDGLRDGEGVHIGIIDSACRLPDHLITDTTVHHGDGHSFIDEEIDDTTRHGTAVFQRVKAFAPNAEYSIYQAVKKNRHLDLGAYSDAITQAIADNIDIINLSVGAPWRHPVHLNPAVKETQRLTDQGIAVVAAAGNHFPRRYDERPPVHCPSAAPEVISVGSLVVRCPKRPGDESATSPEGPYYWLVADPGYEAPLSPDNGVYCGERGCTGGNGCSEHRRPHPWDFNPKPTGNKPDVLAPMHTLRHRRNLPDNRGWPYLSVGTSFSAPLLTGSLASIIGALPSEEKQSALATLRTAVRNGASEFEGSPIQRYNATATYESLTSE